jgi:predicted DNA-binding transcriptional regulator YafY
MARFDPLRRLLPLVAGLYRGHRLGWEEVARDTGLGEQQARRMWRTLVDELGLRIARDGRRKVASLPVEDPEWTPDLEGLVAIKFADAAMEAFRGSDVHARWRELADRAVLTASERARGKFELLRSALVYVRGPHTDLGPVRDSLTEIIDGLACRHRVRLLYRKNGASDWEPCDVEPWSLVLHAGSLYLLAPRRGQDQPKLWKLESVRRCERLKGDTYEYPSAYRFDGARHFERFIGVWTSDLLPVDVVLRFVGRIRDYVEATTWHPTERKTRLEDGGVEVRLTVALTPDLDRWVMGFGEECRVVEPPELATRISARLRPAADQYGSPPAG